MSTWKSLSIETQLKIASLNNSVLTLSPTCALIDLDNKISALGFEVLIKIAMPRVIQIKLEIVSYDNLMQRSLELKKFMKGQLKVFQLNFENATLVVSENPDSLCSSWISEFCFAFPTKQLEDIASKKRNRVLKEDVFEFESRFFTDMEPHHLSQLKCDFNSLFIDLESKYGLVWIN